MVLQVLKVLQGLKDRPDLMEPQALVVLQDKQDSKDPVVTMGTQVLLGRLEMLGPLDHQDLRVQAVPQVNQETQGLRDNKEPQGSQVLWDQLVLQGPWVLLETVDPRDNQGLQGVVEAQGQQEHQGPGD